MFLTKIRPHLPNLLHSPLFLGVVIMSIVAGTVITLTAFHQLAPHRVISVAPEDIKNLKQMNHEELVKHFKQDCKSKGVGIIAGCQGEQDIEVFVCKDGSFGILPVELLPKTE